DCYISSLYVYLTIFVLLFFFILTAPTVIYTLSLHDALPISLSSVPSSRPSARRRSAVASISGGAKPRVLVYEPSGMPSHSSVNRSEEHTSELQSRFDLVCRLLLEKKKKK